MPELAQTPAVAFRTSGLTVMLSTFEVPRWAREDGMMISDVAKNADGTLILTLSRDTRDVPSNRKTRGYADPERDRRFFQFANVPGMEDVPLFGATTVERAAGSEALGEIILTLPAERKALMNQKAPKRVRARKKPMTLEEAKERVAKMRQPPPRDDVPAIPLRAAVDVVNSHKASEGDALELLVDPSGRLKVKFEYGG